MNEGGAMIRQKLAKIYEEITNMKADGRNDFHKYKYLSDDKVTEAYHKEFAKHGVILVPSETNVISSEIFKDSKGKDTFLVTVKVKWRIICSEDKSEIELESVGAGTDKGDKAIYCALTGARKYLLRLLFMLGTSDDPDQFANEIGETSKPSSCERKPKPNPKTVNKWTAQKCRESASPELVQAIRAAGLSMSAVIKLYERYDGDETAIIKEIEEVTQ